MGALGPREGVAGELSDDGDRDEEVLAPATPGAEGLGDAGVGEDEPDEDDAEAR